MVCTIALNLIPIRYDVDGNHELDKDELEWLMCDLLGRDGATRDVDSVLTRTSCIDTYSYLVPP